MVISDCNNCIVYAMKADLREYSLATLPFTFDGESFIGIGMTRPDWYAIDVVQRFLGYS